MSGIRGRGFGADAPQTADRPIPDPRSPTLRTQEVPNGLVHTQTDDGTTADDGMNALDRLTQKASVGLSRRSFLKKAGKAGIVLAGVGAALTVRGCSKTEFCVY